MLSKPESRDGIVAAAAVLVVLLIYVFFASGGRWTRFHDYGSYYDDLATAFRSGRLDLNVQPPAPLLSLNDPYDPNLRNENPIIGAFTGSVYDMSYYNAKIYLYWGPIPALLLAILKVFTAGHIGDQFFVLFFMCGVSVFQALFLFRIWVRFYRILPHWALWAGITTAGLILPTLWLLNSSRIYSAAIAGCQFFFIGGLFFAYTAFENKTNNTRNLWITGLFWAFAIGTRLSILGGVLFFTSLVFIMLIRSLPVEGRLQNVFTKALPIGIPLVLCLITLGWYNLARFGSPWETGLRYQLTWTNLNKNRQQLFSLKYVWPNLFNYSLLPVATDTNFPFVRTLSPIFPPFSNPLQYASYHAEDVTGMLIGAPFLLFSLLPIASLFRKRTDPVRKAAAMKSSNYQDLYDWICTGLFGSSLISILIISFYFYITMRYLADFTLTLSLLAVLGFWQGLALQPKSSLKRAVYSVSAIGLAAWSVGISILLASGVSNPFSALSFPLLQHLIGSFQSVGNHLL